VTGDSLHLVVYERAQRGGYFHMVSGNVWLHKYLLQYWRAEIAPNYPFWKALGLIVEVVVGISSRRHNT
jgi:hypothetical protein